MLNKIHKWGQGGVLAAACAAALMCASCHKACRCFAYDGSMDTYSQDDLEHLGYTCRDMVSADYGLVYTHCEWGQE